MARSERRPRPVRHAGSRALGLPPRALPLSTPGARVQLELLRRLGHASYVADGSDIAPVRVHAQIEVFLRGLKKAEAISIACAAHFTSAVPMTRRSE